MGFSRQEYWSVLPFPSPEDLPNPGTEPGSSAFHADSLPSENITYDPTIPLLGVQTFWDLYKTVSLPWWLRW